MNKNKLLLVLIFLIVSLFNTVYAQNTEVESFCDQDSVLLEAATGYDSYLWNTGATTSSIWAKRSGTFVVKQISTNNIVYDTFLIDLNTSHIIQNDTIVCYGSDFELSLTNLEPYCLTGNYTFNNGSTKDISAYGNDGLVGLPLITIDDRHGQAKQAVQFSPSTTNPPTLSVIQIPYHHTQDIYKSFTIHCWIKPDSIYGTSAMDNIYYIINKWKPIESSLNECSYALTINKEGYISFITSDGTNKQEFNVDITKVPYDQWSMIDVVCALNELKIYIDATLVLSSEISVFPQVLEQPTYIGAALSLLNHNYQGGLDDLRIYTCDLSKQEIQNLKNTNSTYSYICTWSTGEEAETITINPKEATLYTVDIASRYNTCSDDIYIDVYPEFTVDIKQMKKGCPDTEEGMLLVSAKGGVPFSGRLPYEYNFPLGFLSSDSMIYKLPKGEYKITVRDSVGCAITQTVEVETYPRLGIDITCDPVKIYPQKPVISLSSQVECNTCYVHSTFWDFGDGNSSHSISPTHDYGPFDEEVYAEFEIKNIQIYEDGCVDSAIYVLEIAKPNLKIPNVFTPNGDGVNDTFEITLEDDPERTLLEVFMENTLTIYNRQGQLVYTKLNYAGKPGEFDGGNLSDGVYYYILDCKGAKKDTVYKGYVHIFRNTLENFEQR